MDVVTGNIRYVDTLDKVSRKRYDEKLEFCGGLDPYDIDLSVWDEDVNTWPEVEYGDIANYFVFTQSAYIFEEMKAYKALDSYNYFVSGWVSKIGCMYIEPGNNCIVTGKVKHSQRMNEAPLQPWIICEKSGKVICAHCKCMAGLRKAAAILVHCYLLLMQL